jgi:hypothetical protein
MDLKGKFIFTSLIASLSLTTAHTDPQQREEKVGNPGDTPGEFSLVYYPRDVTPGDIVKVVIEGPSVDRIFAEGTLGDQELIFKTGEENNDLFSIAGVDLESKEKKIPLTVIVRTREGKTEVLRSQIGIGEKEFSVQKLYIEEKEYTPERLERIGRERETFQSLWKTITPERLWREGFLQPLPVMTVTSDFGLRRIINDLPRNPHTGVDLSAAAGDTVFAPNRAQVTLSGDFYFNGKSLVLNHGEGFYSMYFHLSDYLVQEGAIIDRGQPIGLVGSTGRSTAPHLHWGIILRGSRLDPLKLLELPI